MLSARDLITCTLLSMKNLQTLQNLLSAMMEVLLSVPIVYRLNIQRFNLQLIARSAIKTRQKQSSKVRHKFAKFVKKRISGLHALYLLLGLVRAATNFVLGAHRSKL